MAIIKCKMCGGTLEMILGSAVATCEYCGSRQTVPAADNDKKLNLFARANRLRAACDFDKAASIYEAIVADFPEEAEAYWGLVLCKYGIEYVDDPATGKKIPTCHRSSFDSVMDDSDFEQTMENADEVALRVYREEAKQIDMICKGILEVSSREQPYDIFICYKETDLNGDRTTDSLLAHDIYDALTAKGYRVFFSRVTLEDKLGQSYEPFIFAALNSAKIMLAVGTCYEHYNAVWVKNEWSRYLKIVMHDKNKYLIPCYKGIDAYDIPKEFAHLQGQDMGKVGAIQDLLRGVDKILSKPVAANAVGSSIQNAAREAVRSIELEKMRKQVENAVSLGIMALDSGDEEKAIKYFEECLKIDSGCIGAYLGLIRAINDEKTAAPYVAQIRKFPIPEIMGYVSNHKDILGDPKKSNTLLERAVRVIRSAELSLLLLEIGADAKSKDVLYYSIRELSDAKVVRTLLEKGADATETFFWSNNKTGIYYSDERYSLLSMAVAWKVDPNIIKALVEAGADVNFVVEKRHRYHEPEDSYSILNNAIRNNDIALVEYLLDRGADPNKGRTTYVYYSDKNDIDRSMAMHYSNVSESIWNLKDKEMLRLLIKHGANLNEVCRCQLYSKKNYSITCLGAAYSTALSDAILYSEDSEFVKILLDAGADARAVYRYHTDGWSERLMGYACKNQYESILPVLGLAIQKSRADVLSMLIKSGASFEDTVTYRYYEDRKLVSDQFPLRVMSFTEDVITPIHSSLQKYGWKGSRAGLFSREHTCYFSW